MRQDPVTGRWVIVATERARRPESFRLARAEPPPGPPPSCPFCPGHERETPPETFAYRAPGTGPDTPGWEVRVVPNKFPAVTPEGAGEPAAVNPALRATITRAGTPGGGHAGGGEARPADLERRRGALGVHEVIIETPHHDRSLATLEQEAVERVVRCYRQRYLEHRGDGRWHYIQLFKNHRREAGASIEHPHSQLIALALVPPAVGEEIEGSREYYLRHHACVYCRMIEAELSGESRVVAINRDFVAFAPYASRLPFETWILPREHRPCFGDLPEEDIAGLASILREILGRVHRHLGDPPYNFMLHTAPPERPGPRDFGRADAGHHAGYHWHLELIPKLTIPAGFELATGMYINITRPEEAARYLREG